MSDEMDTWFTVGEEGWKGGVTDAHAVAEFLLARIDEDETATLNRREALYLTFDDESLYHRLLAECETKRQLITTADRLIRSFDQPGLFWDDVNRRERSHARTTLHLLALPYASHPDYDETWRI